METEFFAGEHGQDLLRRAQRIVEERRDSPKARSLLDAIRIISKNPAEFDRGAAANVDWIGRNLSREIEAAEKSTGPEALDELYATFYRFVTEYELGLPEKTELSHELRAFVEHARQHLEDFTHQARQQIVFANQGMPIQVLKKLLGSSVIQNLRSIEPFAKEVTSKFNAWDEKLRQHTGSVERLEGALKEYQTGFNFVGLHKGFDDLAGEKKSELISLRRSMVMMGALTLLPVAAELLLISMNADRIDDLKWAFAASAVPALSMTVLFAYFFRLAARAVDGAKSQVLQLELRKTLCRFIQSYVEYAKQLKEANTDSLGKFESIIFSGLVSSDDKLPATFDGVEQLASLVKAVRAG